MSRPDWKTDPRVIRRPSLPCVKALKALAEDLESHGGQGSVGAGIGEVVESRLALGHAGVRVAVEKHLD